MKKFAYNISIFAVGFIIVFIQGSFVNYISAFNVKPDFILLFVIIIALKENMYLGIFNGFLLGLLKDAMSLGALGMNSFSMTIVVFLSAGLKSLLYKEDIITSVFSVFLLGCANFLLLFTISNLFKFSFETYPTVTFSAFIGVIYTSVVAPPVFFLYTKVIDLFKLIFKED